MLKVLLVDDEPFIVQGLSLLLDWEKEGCEIVATAQNGMDALAYLKANRVDLIIADIKMPEMTGLELLEIIRREQVSGAYFVILSGYSEFSYAQRAIQYSAMDYVLKPVEKEVLTDIIRKAANLSVTENNSLGAFRRREHICFCEKEIQIKSGGILLCKAELDNLVSCIEQNDKISIHKAVDRLYEELRRMGAMEEMLNLNINYLLFRLIHAATEQDDSVNQETILHLISESSFEDGLMRGSKAHLTRFSCEYAEYLAQLRKKVSRGVLALVEKEIREHFAENLTLRDLGQKYYINNTYLGQLFRRKYNQSFKDYLNNYRIEQAAQLLIRTDDKIYKIAEDVGYKNTDYFINRFIAAKGCTPSKFRKQSMAAIKSID